MNKILQKSAKTLAARSFTQQTILAQVRMMSIMTQKKPVTQQVFGFQPVRNFSEEVQETTQDENPRKYTETGQEIFVQGFDESVTIEMMEEFFGKYGSILKSKLLPHNDRFTGKYWVALDSAEAVDKALEEIGSEAEIGGQTVSVVKSEVRVRRPRY